jgi:threonine aldolase
LSRNFTSDNVTPASAAILAAVQEANSDCEPSYGADRHSLRLAELANAVFETDVAIFPVASGTAANALALAQLVPPYGGVYCHATAHVTTDECAAPEFFTGGAKLLGLPGAQGKVTPAALRAALGHARDMGVHHVKPAALSLTQATEWGTVYQAAELTELCALAREHRLRVHMDGARFANALASLGCSPAAATWRAGVDVLSLGATKNGALCAEAVVFFDPGVAADFARRRKQSGHLWSKMRFLSAQLVAYLQDDLWLRNARHANAMAATLAAGLSEASGARVIGRVEANEVFVALPEACIARLEAAGFGFYRWPVPGVEPAAAIRLVTSYATRAADVAALVRAARGAEAPGN